MSNAIQSERASEDRSSTKLRDAATLPRTCGLVFCYNEEEILRDTLVFYLSQGIDLVVFDNESTDGSVEILDELRCTGDKFSGRLTDVVRVHTDGYDWKEILRQACDYMHRRLSDYEWILLVDADAFYVSPVRGWSLRELLGQVQRYGYNVVDGALYMFYPTDADRGTSPLERIHYCRPYPDWPPEQQRIFRYHPTVDFHTHAAHRLVRNDMRECPVKLIYKHYGWLSFEHGLRRIFANRRPRYSELPRDPQWFMHNLELLPIRSDFVRDPRSLWRFDARRVQVSPFGFRARMNLGALTTAAFKARRALFYRLKRRREEIEHHARVVRYDWRAALDLSKARARRRLGRWIGHRTLGAAGAGSTENESRTFRPMTYTAMAAQPIVTRRLPTRFHFLMTDFCNVRCNFCNQDFDPARRNQMTLGGFQRILANIPALDGLHFSFSGGGEPLLCRDIAAILRSAKDAHADAVSALTTNGLLVEKHAAALVQSGLDEIWLAIHGATVESNNRILQIRGRADPFAGIAALNREMKRTGREVSRVLYTVVSRRNIGEVTDLLRRAAALDVDRMHVALCKYYPWEDYRFDHGARPRREESLYYDPQRYNAVIGEAKRLATSLGVRFSHDRLFFGNYKRRSCRHPWERVMVDVDGTVYPCLGGETWFRDRVRRGEISFGNLAEQHLMLVWNSPGYVAVRRTCSPFTTDDVMPECHDCHQSLELQGPDVEHAHILRRPGDS